MRYYKVHSDHRVKLLKEKTVERQIWKERLNQVFVTGHIPSDIVRDLYQQPWAARQVLVEVIGALDGQDVDGWLILSRLINASRFYCDAIGDALKRRYSPSNKGRNPDAIEARVALLLTLSHMKHRLYPIHLLEEQEIREEMPALWKDLWRQHGMRECLPKEFK